MTLTAACAFAWAATAAPISGFEIAVNNTGFNAAGGTYVPIDSTGTNGKWKAEFVEKIIRDMRPKAGRHMDYWQIVTNPTTRWATRSANDFSDQGLTYETTINIDRQALAENPHYTPWINSPLFADEDHDEQLGFLYGTRYPGARVMVGKGNEGWAIFGNNLPAQQMRAAIAAGEPGNGDLEKAASGWGKRLGRAAAAFRRGWVRAGRDPAGVVMAIEGFAPATVWAQKQIDAMRSIGIEPRDFNAHVSIAQYAAGSDTDLVGPLVTPAEKRDALERFIDTLVGWTLQHRDLARRNGLVDLVDAYEMRLGTHSPTPDWIAFQGTPEQAEVQEYGFRKLIEASGGVAATLNAEGFVGFPWTSGIFSLADLGQLNNPYQSQAYAATHGLIDFSAIPEPNGPVVAVVLFVCWRAGRRGRLA